MREPRLQNDLTRATIDGFALPLGLLPVGVDAPMQGFTIDYEPARDEDPDTYTFNVVVSHELVKPLFERLLSLMPDTVFGIVEIGSRDAYRPVDVYMGHTPVSLGTFRTMLADLDPFIYEDAALAVGALGEEPYIEIFLDQWKGILVHAPLSMRDEVERLLLECGLHEVPETWPRDDNGRALEGLRPRQVLAIEDEYSADVDEVLLQLRHAWYLELNVDPERNVDEAGRDLGRTLWHAMVIVESLDDPEGGAYASIWATAGSLREVEHLITDTIDASGRWRFSDLYTLDRVAYDERPQELNDMPPGTRAPGVHIVQFDQWPPPPDDEHAEPPVRPDGRGAAETRRAHGGASPDSGVGLDEAGS